MKCAALSLLLVAACAEPSPDDIAPPHAGTVHRFIVDEIDIVRPTEESRAFADDLDGDGRADDALNKTIGFLMQVEATTPAGNDQVRARSISSVVNIVADDLVDAPAASIEYLGFEGAPATPVGGRFVNGRFLSNRSRDTSIPGAATLVLPVVLDADASVIEAERMEMDLAPSPRGGYDLVLRGGISVEDFKAEAGARLVQMVEANPRAHLFLARYGDANGDGELRPEEIAESNLYSSFFTPDLDARYISFWVRVHLTPCAAGSCGEAVEPTCFDRIANQAESDVDCGGPCQPCGDLFACVAPDDCFSGACDIGACRATTCSDGALNGLESDVDCGGPCGDCSTQKACIVDIDCASGACEGSECL